MDVIGQCEGILKRVETASAFWIANPVRIAGSNLVAVVVETTEIPATLTSQPGCGRKPGGLELAHSMLKGAQLDLEGADFWSQLQQQPPQMVTNESRGAIQTDLERNRNLITPSWVVVVSTGRIGTEGGTPTHLQDLPRQRLQRRHRQARNMANFGGLRPRETFVSQIIRSRSGCNQQKQTCQARSSEETTDQWHEQTKTLKFINLIQKYCS